MWRPYKRTRIDNLSINQVVIPVIPGTTNRTRDLYWTRTFICPPRPKAANHHHHNTTTQQNNHHAFFPISIRNGTLLTNNDATAEPPSTPLPTKPQTPQFGKIKPAKPTRLKPLIPFTDNTDFNIPCPKIKLDKRGELLQEREKNISTTPRQQPAPTHRLHAHPRLVQRPRKTLKSFRAVRTDPTARRLQPRNNPHPRTITLPLGALQRTARRHSALCG